MHFEKPKWQESFVLICTKCGKNKNNLAKNPLEKVSETFAEDLKNKVKMDMKNQGLAAKTRVMTSGCLGTCPENLQSIAFVNANQKQEKIMICDFASAESELRKELKIESTKV